MALMHSLWRTLLGRQGTCACPRGCGCACSRSGTCPSGTSVACRVASRPRASCRTCGTWCRPSHEGVPFLESELYPRPFSLHGSEAYRTGGWPLRTACRTPTADVCLLVTSGCIVLARHTLNLDAELVQCPAGPPKTEPSAARICTGSPRSRGARISSESSTRSLSPGRSRPLSRGWTARPWL